MKINKTFMTEAKKISAFTLSFILMLFMSASFSACGDDEDEPEDPNNEIVGKWQLSNYSTYPSFYTIEFNANHSATIVYEPGDSPELTNEWRTNGNKLYIYFDTEYGHDDYLVGTYSISNNVMTYTCNYSDEEATFILTKI